MFAPLSLLLALTLTGVNALNSTAQPMHAIMEASPRAPLREHLILREFGAGETAPIRYYDRDMTKYVHLIAVDDRLQTFMHVHPALQRDGRFLLDLTFPHGGLWHLYADGMPHNFGRQVFRFDLNLPGSTPPRSVRRVTAVSHAGPYTVILDRSSLSATRMSMVMVRIEKNGKPATDLQPYLGARAHAVVIGTDLSYIHAHAMSATLSRTMRMSSGMKMDGMNMPAASKAPAPMATDDPCNQDADLGMSMVELPASSHVGATMSVMLTPVRPGPYYLWVQFRGATSVYTAPFVLSVH
ncbi:MAG: hypothetical protein M3126_10855 [Candidatus Eremiobacteraeota bacterium]|nr:hypothetical protein [Candidatus Eremiobacteraeota bacterium]